MIWRAGVLVLMAGLAGPAIAAERSYSITEFDTIDVDGAYQVSVETGKAPSVRASGNQVGIDQLRVEIRSQRLVIRTLKNNWGERSFLKPGLVTIRVTVPGLKRADIAGSGSMTITRIRAARLSLSLEGSGQLRVDQLDVDQFDLASAGNGLVVLAGKVLSGRLSNSGTGRIEAGGLTVSDLDLKSDSAGLSRIGALRSAKIASAGSGNVIITGKPACTVTELGSGVVTCGLGR